NTGKIAGILRHGLVINFINSLLLVGVVSVGKNILYHINQPPEVVEEAIPYLSIITYSLIPMRVSQSFKQSAERLSKTQLAMVVIISTNLINIVLNYLLIYGHGGFPALGLKGAGWATLISRTIMMMAIVLYVYYAPAFREFRSGFAMKNFSTKTF